jgi:hypothetical protein
MRIRALQNDSNPSFGQGDSFGGAVALLDDVVPVFVLSHQEVNAGVGLHTFNGRCIGTALADGYLLGRLNG